MNQLFPRRITATLLAAGLLLSACGQSDASGRIRNSSIGDGCFITQDEKDKEIRYYQDFLDLATTTKNEFETIDKAVKALQFLLTDLYNQTTEALNKSGANPSPENIARVLAVNTELDAKQKELNDLFPKLFEAQRNIREYPQFETVLQDVQNKPVCESTPVTSAALASPEVTTNLEPTPIPSSPDDIINDASGKATKTNVEECQQPLKVKGEVNQVIRVGEILEFIFPLCSEDSYVTVWGDFETGLTVYSNEIVTDNKPHVVIRLSSNQPLSGTYFFQQIDRISTTASPKSRLDLSVIEADAPVLCEGKVPRVEMSAEGALLAESTCDATEYIEIRISNIETGHLVVDTVVWNEKGTAYRSDNMDYVYSTDAHEVVAYHVERGKEIDKRIGGRLGDVLTFEFQLKPKPQKSPGSTVNFFAKVDLPPFFDVEPDTQPASTPDDSYIVVLDPKILIAPTTAGVSCSVSCIENIFKQVGVTTSEVQTIEASINGATWVNLTPETTLPLIDAANKVSVRVTPKDGSKPVVLTNTLYRSPEAMSGSDEAEVVAVSVGGEQTITVEPASSGMSSAQIILIVVAGVILLLLAMLFIRSRRKSVA
jgi:hypothetical protein